MGREIGRPCNITIGAPDRKNQAQPIKTMIVPQPPILDTTGLSTDPTELLELGRGVFALVLFAVSLYAWFRRKRPGLIIVATAFLLFFAKTVLDVLLPKSTLLGLTREFIDFAALALFFVAIVVRPRKDIGKERLADSNSDPRSDISRETEL